MTPDRLMLEFLIHAQNGELEAASRLFDDLPKRGSIVNPTDRTRISPVATSFAFVQMEQQALLFLDVVPCVHHSGKFWREVKEKPSVG